MRGAVRVRRCGLIALALTCALPFCAYGEVRVEGNPAAVRITTSNDSVAAVLSAIEANFNVRYRSAIDLDTPANSTYVGPIERVIANLLDGFNYVVKKNDNKTEIIIFGRRGEAAVPPPPPKPPQPIGILSRWP